MRFDRVLVTGGAGFIAWHLIEELKRQNSNIRIVSLDTMVPKRACASVEYVIHDVRRLYHSAVDERCDVLFNLAAVHRTPGHPDHEYFETNVAGATNAVRYCDRHSIKTMVFTSSISVYGPSESPLDEKSPPNPNHAYGRSKWLAEEIHRAWVERAPDNRLVVVRPAIVFGEGENGNYTRLIRLLNRGTFAFPGRTDTRKAGFYVKELVRSIGFALDKANPSYLYNFAYPECPTIKEICKILRDVAQLRAPLGTIPLLPMELAAIPFEILNTIGVRNAINRDRIRKLIHSTYVLPRQLMDDRYRFSYSYATAFADWLGDDGDLGVRLRPDAKLEVLAPAQTVSD